MQEMQKAPWTSLAVLLACSTALWNWNTKATADDLSKVRAQVESLQAEVGQVNGKVDVIATSLLEGKLIEARVRYCLALRTRDEPTKFYGELTRDLAGRYFELTGRVYQLPECSEI